MRIFAAIAGLALLGACGTTQVKSFVTQIETLDVVQAADRGIDKNYRDQPFAAGPVYVVANEHGDLHTYSLTPCRDGTRICGGSGHVGHLQRTETHYIVTGAYPQRTFYLSPGGDGILKWRGENRDLAWN